MALNVKGHLTPCSSCLLPKANRPFITAHFQRCNITPATIGGASFFFESTERACASGPSESSITYTRHTYTRYMRDAALMPLSRGLRHASHHLYRTVHDAASTAPSWVVVRVICSRSPKCASSFERFLSTGSCSQPPQRRQSVRSASESCKNNSDQVSRSSEVRVVSSMDPTDTHV